MLTCRFRLFFFVLGFAAVLTLAACGGRRYAWEEGSENPNRSVAASDAEEMQARQVQVDRLWPLRDQTDARAQLLDHLAALTQGGASPRAGAPDAVRADAASRARYRHLVQLSRTFYLEGTQASSREARRQAFEQGMFAADRALYELLRDYYHQDPAARQ